MQHPDFNLAGQVANPRQGQAGFEPALRCVIAFELQLRKQQGTASHRARLQLQME